MATRARVQRPCKNIKGSGRETGLGGRGNTRPPEVPVAPIATKIGEPLKRREGRMAIISRTAFRRSSPPDSAAGALMPDRRRGQQRGEFHSYHHCYEAARRARSRTWGRMYVGIAC